MSVAEIEKLLSDYRQWLQEKTTLREVDDTWVEITTPYLDRHNDSLQIYARQENGGFLLSDDSYTIHDLEASGCNLHTDKRQDLLRMTLNGFGVKLDHEALQIHATALTFPLRKHNLIQAMLAVNDLFYLATPIVESLFFEDVVAWLDGNDVRYTPKVKFIQAINRPTRDSAESFIHAWSDTREVRPSDSKAYALLNDTEQSISGSVMEALRNYQIRPIPWTQRVDVVAELAA